MTCHTVKNEDIHKSLTSQFELLLACDWPQVGVDSIPIMTYFWQFLGSSCSV